MIIEDVIVAVPSFTRMYLTEYCREQNAKEWANYTRQQSEPNYVKGMKLIYEDLPYLVKAPLRTSRFFYKWVSKSWARTKRYGSGSR